MKGCTAGNLPVYEGMYCMLAMQEQLPVYEGMYCMLAMHDCLKAPALRDCLRFPLSSPIKTSCKGFSIFLLYLNKFKQS